MATPESYGIDMGADTEATFGTSADSMGVCFKHTPGGELSGGHWGVNQFPRVPNTAPWTVVNANRDPDRPLSTGDKPLTPFPMLSSGKGKQLSDADPPRVLAYPFSGPIGP